MMRVAVERSIKNPFIRYENFPKSENLWCNMKVTITKRTLSFKFDAGTSRGILKTRDVWYLSMQDQSIPGITGIGEIAPLKGLSIDDRPDFEIVLERIRGELEGHNFVSLNGASIVDTFNIQDFPSIVFGIEMAILDMLNGGKRQFFNPNDFYEGRQRIPINGLIWMGRREFMQEQIEHKLQEGYTCLKMKIGALDLDTECELLEAIRKHYSADQITLRLDANGAFNQSNAMEILWRLAAYDIHSIEQPVREGQSELMADLCANAPVPVALDEELIGIYGYDNKYTLLEYCRPPYIILKPSLLGGFKACDEWIQIADALGIGWWMTSALESNIGLNAIAQYTSSRADRSMPQGLGTGQLYTNNIDSPLEIVQGSLQYNELLGWGDFHCPLVGQK